MILKNLLIATLLCTIFNSYAQPSSTKVSIKGEDFYINDQITLKGKSYKGMNLQGLLPNSRMVQGTFDDKNSATRSRWKYPDTGVWDAERNVKEFVEAMPLWRANGLLAITVNFQGGSPQGYSGAQPWHNSGFNADGSLDNAYLNRLERIIKKANELGMVVMVGYFYFGQDERIEDEKAVIAAVRNLTEWLLKSGNQNVLVEINNECDLRYDHAILQPARVHELMNLVKSIQLDGRRLPVSTSFTGGEIPTNNVLTASDYVLLHGNGVGNPAEIEKMVKTVRSNVLYAGQPIVFNEDDHYNFDKPANNFLSATKMHASWGFFDFRRTDEALVEGYQNLPVDWGINSDRKKAFFGLLSTMSGCSPISTLSCENLQVTLPFSLNFDASVEGTIVDKNGAGTGFTMVASYSGSRLTQDGTPTNANVPGYEPSKLTVTSGRLQVITNKGIGHLTNNNQLNTLGVQVNSQEKLQLETTIVSPFNGGASQQAGLWFGLTDKTFIKLNISANRVELRKETNDTSSDVSSTTNPDQRITGTISNLNTRTVRLRLIIDPATNTVEGFYSTDGSTFVNVGSAYPAKTLNISGMGLTSGTAYAGIFATHRNSATPVTYNFEDFNIKSLNSSSNAPVFSSSTYNNSIPDNVAVASVVGSVKATDADGDAITYDIISGNTNGAFSINASTGEIRLAKVVNSHKQNNYVLAVRASDVKGLSANANVNIDVTIGTTAPNYNALSWGTVAGQPFGTHEAHGEVVNGRIYVFGGFDLKKQPTFTPTKRSYVYNPSNNSWSAIADLPHTPTGTDFGGISHEGMTSDGTDIYMAGGYTSNANGTGQIFGTKQVWKYNVASNTYSALPDLPHELAAGQLQYLKGRIHYLGGADKARKDVAVHYVLNLDSLEAGWKVLAPISDARNHPGTAVYNGKIYVIGGSHGQNTQAITQKITEVYNSDNNTWTRLADMPIGLDHINSSTTILGDRIIVLGGQTSHNVPSSKVYAYSPSSNSWTSLTPIPIARAAGVAVELKGAIYYIGGNFSPVSRKATPITSSQSSARLALAETEETRSDEIIKVYPNPAKGEKIQVNITQQNQKEKIKLNLIDMLGRIHEQQNLTTDDQGNASTSLKSSERLPAGLYLLQVQTSDGTVTRKMVVD